MLKNCPEPFYVQDLQFKLRCRLKVFDNEKVDIFTDFCSLVSAASRYGLLFVGSFLPILQVIQTKCIENYSSKDKEDISNYPRRTIPLPNVPLHVSVNCDCTILAVVLEKDNCPTVVFYDVLSFYKQNVAIIKEIRLSATPGTLISQVGWNPALPGVFTACKKDGSLGVYEIKDNIIDVNEIPPAAEACCFCWSPKGKRIAVGSRNGKITQYKPDLKPVAVINPPPLDASHSLISLQWVASYQFIGIYQSMDAADQTKLIVIDAPKTGENVYINYEDICYSGSTRKSYFYMIFQQHWNILMVASSNSSELGVLGMCEENWLQWILPDTGRAELPLTTNYQDAFPVGTCFDTSPTSPMPWGEDTIPPCPYLVLLSHTGVMCIFDVVNLKQGTPTVCSPPENIVNTSGLSLFTTSQPTVIEVNLGVAADASPMPTKTPTTAAVIVPQQPLPTYKPSTFSFAQQPQTPKVEIAPPSVAVGQSAAAPALPPAPSAFHSQVQPRSEQPLFGEQQSGSSLTFGAAGVTGDVVQLKSTQNPTTGKTSLKDATTVLLEKMIKEECACLDVQIKALLAQGRSGGKIDIGDGEKSQLVKQLQEPLKFIEEIVEVCFAQNAEVHSLQHDLIFSWALYEDTLSRYNSKEDTLLMESQPLDPVAERRQVETKKTLYYIESQLSQASKALDEKWDRFQDYAKRTYRTQQVPTMEAIFQTMVRQNAILQKQKYLLKDIRSHLKYKSTGRDESHMLLSLDNAAQLSNEMQKLSIGTEAVQKSYYKKSVHRTERFTEKKNYKLRDVLKDRSVTHVSSVQPQLLSVLDTSRSKLKSLLSTPMTPVPKPSQKENEQQFFQSTPIKNEQSPSKPLPLKSPTKQSTTRSTTAAFQPLSSATPSAFASTAQPQSKLLNFQSQPVSKPLFADSSNSTFTFGSPFTAKVEKTPIVAASNSNNSKTLTVKPVTRSFDINTEASSSLSLTTTPVASSAFSTSNPTMFECRTTVQSKTFPITSVANTKVALASGTTAFNVTPQFTPNLGSSGTTMPTSSMTPKTTAASTTGTTVATPACPQIVSAALSPTTSLSTVVRSEVPVSSTIAPANSDSSTITSEPSKPATTRSTSIFGNAASTTLFGNSSASSSVPGAAVTNTNTTRSSSSTPTVAAASLNTPAFNTTTTATSIFGQAMPVSGNLSTTTSSISAFGVQSSTLQSFGNSASSGSTFTTTSSVTTRASIFGSTATTTVSTPTFGSTKSGVPVFGSSVASTSPSSTGSIFCSGTTGTIFSFPVSTTSSSSIFGSGKTVISSGGSTFKAPSTSTTSGTVFGASTTQAVSIFSNATVASISPSAAPVFGSAVSTTSSSGSIFRGSGAVPIFGGGTTSGSSTFGSVTTSAVSLFGVKPTTTMSIFDSVPASTMPSVFGGTSPSTSTTSSIFGSTSIPSARTTSSVFGGTSPPTSTTASVFGSTSTPSARTTSSVFGGGSPVFGQTASIFGSVTNTQSGSSNFPTTSPSQGGSIFSFKTGGDSSPSFFGAGNTTDPTKSIFGSHTPAASVRGSVFGAAPAASATSPFGSEPVFGGATPAGTTSPFGQGATFGFGGLAVNARDGSGTSNFGSTTSSPAPRANPFSNTAEQKSIFGSGGAAFGSSTSIFGSAATGGSFRQAGVSSESAGGGPFTGGAGISISQTGFAATTSGTSAPAFGAPPSFGGAPAFGAAPAFSSSTGFGSPQSKLFGAVAAQPQSPSNIAQCGTAGSTGSPGFGNLANQNIIGFGNLAQQAQTPSSTPFSGNSSFSTWR